MSFKNVDHCVDNGTMSSRYKDEILTVWSGPGGGHSLVDARGKESAVICEHPLPRKLLELGRDIWSLINWVWCFNMFFSEVKRKRKNSRCGGRKARHTNPVETAFLRANLPSMQTLVFTYNFLQKSKIILRNRRIHTSLPSVSACAT